MTHPLRTRTHLEALLIALARVRPDLPELLLASVDRDRVSPACWTLLEEIAFSDSDFVDAATAGQEGIMARSDALTLGELLEQPPEVVIAFANELPARVKQPERWERDLARAQETAA